DVLDQYGNIVTGDNSTVVSIGLLPNEGRGPVFIGNSTIKGANTPRPAPTTPPFTNPPDGGSYDFQATGAAKNGVGTFDDLYINFVGSNYILSAGAASFATHAGADSAPFSVAAAPAETLVFANLVDSSNAEASFNFTLPGGKPPPLPGVNGVVVEALD